jgi:hypothetical protein
VELFTKYVWPIFVLFSIAGIVGLALLPTKRSSKPWFAAATVFLLVLIVVGWSTARSDPSGRDGVEDDLRDDDYVPPVIVESDIEKLRQRWDSEETADWPAANVLAEIADIAYLPPVDAGRSLRDIGFEKVETVDSNTMLGYVAIAENVAVIAFRGSENQAGDWLTNIQRKPTPIAGGDVHSGFWSRYERLKPQIESALRGRDIDYLWITGHSLGGALALCCAHDFDQDQRNVTGVMTFGQPKIARRNLADQINDRFLGRYARFVNNNDFVARIPPSYEFCGRLVWFTPDGLKRSPRRQVAFRSTGSPVDDAEIAEVNPASEEELQEWLAELQQPSPQVDEQGEILPQGSSPYIADHSMLFYIEKVLGLLKD